MVLKLLIASMAFTFALTAQVLEGTVVDSISREPVAGAVVDVELWRSGKAAYQATADESGHFRIQDVKDGAYSFLYAAPGHVQASRGPIRVAAGTTSEPLELLLIRTATLSIRVIDEHGKAVYTTLRFGSPEGVFIKPTDSGGKLEMEVTPSGPFTLAADAPPRLKAPDPDPLTGRAMAWARTHYPGTAMAEAAAKIQLQPGEKREIEIKLLAVPARAIRGVVLNLDGSPAAGVKVTADTDGWAGCSVDSKSDGAFEIPCAVDARWLVSAEAHLGDLILRAGTRIEVLGHDADNIKLCLSPSFTVRGRIAIDTPQGAKAVAVPALTLDPLSSMASTASKPDGDTNFTFEEVYPGPHTLRAPFQIADLYYLDAVYWGSDPWPSTGASPVQILSGSSAVTVVYKMDGGAIRGTAENCKSGGVFLVAHDHGWIVGGKCDAQDHYEINAVRPGDYLVVAAQGASWSSTPPINLVMVRDVLSKATSATVKAGQVTTVDLQAISRDEY